MIDEASGFLNRYAEEFYTAHGHYPPGRRYVFGRLLTDGDVTTVEDVYESTNGAWESCPCPGLMICGSGTCRWVRPGDV